MIEDEKIKTIKNWSKSTLVRDIQVFIDFANFYQYFIQAFSKIAISLSLMLKTTRLSEELALKAFKTDNNKVVGNDDNGVDKIVIGLSKFKNMKFWKLTYVLNIGAIGKPNLLTPNNKKALNYLQLAFIKSPIYQHFDPKSYI